MKNKCVTSQDDTNRHTAHDWLNSLLIIIFFLLVWLCLIVLKIANDDDDVHSRAHE